MNKEVRELMVEELFAANAASIDAHLTAGKMSVFCDKIFTNQCWRNRTAKQQRRICFHGIYQRRYHRP